MKTEYIFQSLTKDKKSKLYTQSFNTKEAALDTYRQMSEIGQNQHFRVIKREVSEEVIAESDDYRQARFDFVD
jgi:hypothetical protein